MRECRDLRDQRLHFSDDLHNYNWTSNVFVVGVIDTKPVILYCIFLKGECGCELCILYISLTFIFNKGEKTSWMDKG